MEILTSWSQDSLAGFSFGVSCLSCSLSLFLISPDLTSFSFSSCVVQAICTEAGLMALRERRMKVTNEDFKKSKENVLYKKQEGTPEGLYL